VLAYDLLSEETVTVLLPKGKLPLDLLRELVYRNLPMAGHPLRIPTPNIGRAGSIVVSVDPVAGVPLDSYGFFAVHYSASDVAVKGAQPRYLMLDICYPAGTSARWLSKTTGEIGAEARKYGITVLGGHTGAYDGISLPFISTTCIGHAQGHRVFGPQSIREGDQLLLAGPLCLESAWLAASVKPQAVERCLGARARRRISGRMRDLTPLPNALAALKLGAKHLHDITEGGLASALQELSHAAGKSIIMEKDKLPFDEDSLNLIMALGEDPCSASSFGALLIAASPMQAERIMSRQGAFGGPLTIGGRFEKGRAVLLLSEGHAIRLRPSRDIYHRFSSELQGSSGT
jgi:hydrogenase expression/formation protein HypE